MSRIPSFRDLEVWKKAMKLVRRVYDLTRSYPSDEKYGLVAETRKSARSIPSNIAERKMRLSAKDFRKFISIALGSLGEIQTQLLMAVELEYLGGIAVEAEIEELGRMLRGLERSLAASAIA